MHTCLTAQILCNEAYSTHVQYAGKIKLHMASQNLFFSPRPSWERGESEVRRAVPWWWGRAGSGWTAAALCSRCWGRRRWWAAWCVCWWSSWSRLAVRRCRRAPAIHTPHSGQRSEPPRTPPEPGAWTASSSRNCRSQTTGHCKLMNTIIEIQQNFTKTTAKQHRSL